jgi:tripartite-type tricarboxylate transporter receptor subunit TctC
VQFDPVTLPHIKAGRLKGLAIVGEERWPDKPDIPTMKEQGYGKNGGDAWFGILAPAATPAAIVEKFSTAIGEALTSPETIERLRGTANYASYLGPAAFRDIITRESKAFADIIRRSNIKV